MHRLWIIEAEKSEVPTSIRLANIEPIYARCLQKKFW